MDWAAADQARAKLIRLCLKTEVAADEDVGRYNNHVFRQNLADRLAFGQVD